MKYEAPTVEFIQFDNDKLMSNAVSGSCKCYLDIGVEDDYDAAGSACWRDSEDATAYDMHDAGVS